MSIISGIRENVNAVPIDRFAFELDTTTTFGPNAICNRAQAVTFLYRTFS